MGMAASQARYLGLTARKTNVEYEGQQVNQARTALANQLNNTFNDLIALEVPTAPSTQDYTTTQYSYEDGTVGETISSMTPLDNDPDGYNYLVTHFHYADVFTGIENKKRNPQVYVSDRVDNKEMEENKIQTTTDPNTGEVTYSIKGNECTAYDENDAAQKAVYDQLANSYSDIKNADPENLLTYKDAGGNIHFVMKDQVESAATGTENPETGTSDFSDYYIKNSKSTMESIAGNTVTGTTDPQSGATSYAVNGNTCTKYDETNEELKAAYEKAVSENPALGKLNPEQLYTYTDENDGIHFISEDDLNGIISGTSSGNDYSVSYGVPVMVGNVELSVYDPDDKEQSAAYEQILKDWPTSVFANSDSTIYTWESSGQRYFASEEELMASWESAPDPTKPTENQNTLNYYCAKDVSTKIEVTEKALIDFNDQGRAESIRFEDSSLVLPLITETKTDEEAYQDAMNQYNYNQAVYEKEIENINAKTEKIQQQDRTLELRLRQLDTEQEALQTEMEAVKKVIDKNIESTFKTFDS